MSLPLNVDRRLAYFVREAWPSVSTRTTLTEGLLSQGEELHITSEMEHGGVAFGDGIETDRILIGWGHEVTISRSAGETEAGGVMRSDNRVPGNRTHPMSSIVPL